MSKIKLYVSCHKISRVPIDSIFCPIQVGTAIAGKRFENMLHDDTGDNISTKNPMYCTSLGKVILAYTDEDTRQQIVNRIKFSRKTENTIMTKAELEKELEKVRNQGYALDAREMEDHMECAGAAVFGPDGSVMGAISVSSLYKPGEDYDALGSLVCKKAAEVSRLLGFLGKTS